MFQMKKIISVLAVAAALAFLAGCSSGHPASAANPAASESGIVSSEAIPEARLETLPAKPAGGAQKDIQEGPPENETVPAMTVPVPGEKPEDSGAASPELPPGFSPEDSDAGEKGSGKKVYKIGIVRSGDHSPQSLVEQNIKEELDALGEELGCVFQYDEFTFSGRENEILLYRIASQLMDDEVDLIIPIAEQAALAMQNACGESGIPVVFAAVEDPVAAGLADSREVPGGNITGTSDYLDISAVMNLVFAENPDAKDTDICQYGPDYPDIGRVTADMAAMILVDGADPSVLPVQTFEKGIAEVNTETCRAAGVDPEKLEEAFAPYCTKIIEIGKRKADGQG